MAQDVAIASSSHDENINIFYMSKIKTVYFTRKIYFCTSRWLAHKKKDRTNFCTGKQGTLQCNAIYFYWDETNTCISKILV